MLKNAQNVMPTSLWQLNSICTKVTPVASASHVQLKVILSTRKRFNLGSIDSLMKTPKDPTWLNITIITKISSQSIEESSRKEILNITENTLELM